MQSAERRVQLLGAVGLLFGLIASVAYAQASRPASESINILPGHPRIFFTQEDIPRLREKIKREPVATLFRSLKAGVDRELNTARARTDFNYGYYSNQMMQSMAFVYLMTLDRKYLDACLERMDKMTLVGQGGGMGRINNLPEVYDWLFQELPEGVRKAVGKKITDYGVSLNPSGWTGRGGFNPSESSWNIFFAVAGDGYNDDAMRGKAASEFANMKDNFIRTMDAINGDGGVDGYAMLQTAFMYTLAEGMRVPTGQDLFQTSSYLRGCGDFWIHKLRGDLRDSRNVAKNNQADTYRGAMYAILSARYKDPYYQYMFNHYFMPMAQGEIGNLPVIIANYDPSLPERPLDDGFDKVRLFMKTGFLFMRDSWDFGKGSKAIHAMLFDGPNTYGHATQGHFLIARGADSLAIDSGAYHGDDDRHYGSYYERTVAHNSIIVYDKDETFGRNSPSDGGQVPDMYWQEPGTPRRYPSISNPGGYRGEIERFVNRPDYSYAFANMGPAYRSRKVDFVTREFVYLKPNLFVVFDRVAAKSEDFNKRFLLHMVDEPKSNGTEKVIDGVLGKGGVFESTDGNLVTVERGQSRMYCRTLLPVNHILRRIGGANKAGEFCKQTFDKNHFTYSDNGQSYEFWVNGVNWTPKTTDQRFNPGEAQNLDNHPADEAGKWRIEVEAADKSKAEYFLHVLSVGDKALVEPETKLLEGEMPGVEIKSGARIYRVSFHKNGRSPGQIEILEGNNQILSEPFPMQIIQSYVYPEKRK